MSVISISDHLPRNYMDVMARRDPAASDTQPRIEDAKTERVTQEIFQDGTLLQKLFEQIILEVSYQIPNSLTISLGLRCSEAEKASDSVKIHHLDDAAIKRIIDCFVKKMGLHDSGDVALDLNNKDQIVEKFSEWMQRYGMETLKDIEKTT